MSPTRWLDIIGDYITNHFQPVFVSVPGLFGHEYNKDIELSTIRIEAEVP